MVYAYVNTPFGRVEGSVLHSPSDGYPQVLEFLGLPYATPPIGELRFMHPLPYKNGHPSDTISAKRFSPSPWQFNTRDQGHTHRGREMWIPAQSRMSEDCLYVNIWTPVSKNRPVIPAHNLPVLVWFYGGGFDSGSACIPIYMGNVLASICKTVVVTFNYRVGPLGFLYLPQANIYGNQGLHDQILVLEWVTENIHYFGGNPNCVCLFGESAGAVSISYHLHNPSSWRHFSKAILLSGTILCPWLCVSKDEAARRSRLFADNLHGSKHQNDKMRLITLRKASPINMLKQINQISTGSQYLWPWLPLLADNGSDSHPLKLHSTATILCGTVQNEGSVYISKSLIKFLHNDVVPSSSFHLGTCCEFCQATSLSSLKTVKDVVEYYRQDCTTSRNVNEELSLNTLDSLISDWWFVMPVLQYVNVIRDKTKVFVCKFSYRSQSKHVNPWPSWMGITHGSEIEFWFGRPYDGLILSPTLNDVKTEQIIHYSEDEKAFTSQLFDVLCQFLSTNFNVKTANVKCINEINLAFSSGSVTWPCYTKESPAQLIMDREMQIEEIPHQLMERVSFWEEAIPHLRIITTTNTNT